MRTIKFRAWHKKQKYMQEVDGCDLYLAAGQIYEESCAGWEGSDMVVTDEYELMQFTGLLDKNGKEIYEGDILKVPALILPPDEGGFVKDENKQIVKYQACADGCYGETLYVGYCIIIGEVGDERDERICEVIGNIYQNPELLQSCWNAPAAILGE